MTPLQERAIHCIRRLILGICNEPHRCVVHVDREGSFPRIAAQPCPNDYPILHGKDGRQTNAFMSMAQRLDVQYELIDSHGVEHLPHNSSYLDNKSTLDEALELLHELCFLLFGRQLLITKRNTPINGNVLKLEMKVWLEVNRYNRDEMAIVSLLADLLYPWSWNQLDTVIKVRPGYDKRRKANV